MRSREIGLVLVAVLVAAQPAWGWGNRISHQDLFDASVQSGSAARRLEELLVGQVGVREGADARLAVQLGFDDEVDEEIGAAGGKGSRLTDNLTKDEPVCEGISFLSALDATNVLVSTWCYPQRVSNIDNPVWESVGHLKREVRMARVEPSSREPGRLEARLTHRVHIGTDATGSIVSCGGTVDTCWERSTEPSGEEASEELTPVWSPDGGRFAFLRRPRRDDSAATEIGGGEVWVAEVASGAVRRVLTRAHGDPYRLTWDPAGRRLLLALFDGERTDVVLVDPEGPETQVPGRLARFSYPDDARFSLYAPLVLPVQGP